MPHIGGKAAERARNMYRRDTCHKQRENELYPEFQHGRCGSVLLQQKKSLKALYGLPVLSKFTGVLCHDHETALYHFGTGHVECNVHLGRYLRKNTEETGNTWSRDMESFLNGMNSMRQKFMDAGKSKIPEEKLAKYMARFDAIISQGYEQNETTRGKIAK